MKTSLFFLINLVLLQAILTGCEKNTASPVPASQGNGETGFVSGKVTDARGNAMPGVKVVIEHTVWFGTYLFATTDNQGNYRLAIPTDPAGSWTAKAQIERTAYGKAYTFDLHPVHEGSFNRNGPAVRDFTWKLSGRRPGTETYYGAHLDLYQFGTDVPMNQVKIIFTPAAGETQLIDGSPAVAFERTVEDVSGTFMVKDIPVGRYSVKAVYPGKNLKLDNRHDNGDAETNKTVVFGKNGYLASTEYNIEFWLTE
jgi:hypothetical protein